MARNTTLIRLLDMLRAETRQSLNAAHSTSTRETQINMLQRTQEWLWDDFAWPNLRAYRETPALAGERFYETPEDINVDRIEKIEVFRDGYWTVLSPSLTSAEYGVFNSELDERSWPIRAWRIAENEDIEVWPIPDISGDAVTQEGIIRFTGIRNLRPLVDDEDRADLDDRLIVLFAAAEYLAAAGAKDAQFKQQQANARYGKLRSELTIRRTFRMFGVGAPARDRRSYIGRYRAPV